MIAELTIFEIYPGREAAWHEVWQQMHAAREVAEGFLGDRLFHEVDRPERHLVLSEWENRACLDSFARHIGATWLLDEWELGPAPIRPIVLQEYS
jgi:heme-degrading monooxygenase HmoA